MTESPEHRRRIDRVLDPTFVRDLPGLSVRELRSRLREAREEEEDYSYYRRMLHARIDALRAPEESEAGKSSRDTAAASPVGRRGARPRLAPKAIDSPGRRDVERLLSEPLLAKADEMTPSERAEVLERLDDWESKISSARKDLHQVIDSLEAELAVRYRDGLEPSLDRLQ